MIRPLRVLIADDEPLARARLSRLLGQEQAVEIVAVCSTGRQVLAYLRSNPCDVAFLDIRMPDLDGFAVLERLPAVGLPQVVFVTAHPEHAVRAFDAEAIDFLLKPVAPDRLHATVARIRQRVAGRSDGHRAPSAVVLDPGAAFPERLALPVGRRLRVVALAEVEYAQAQGNYVELHAGDRSYLVRSTIAELAARLDPARFARVHRSRIVRLDAIDSLERHGAGQFRLQLRSGKRLLTGRSYRQRIRDALGLGPLAPLATLPSAPPPDLLG